jgi:hypothetical protein
VYLSQSVCLASYTGAQQPSEIQHWTAVRLLGCRCCPGLHRPILQPHVLFVQSWVVRKPLSLDSLRWMLSTSRRHQGG